MVFGGMGEEEGGREGRGESRLLVLGLKRDVRNEGARSGIGDGSKISMNRISISGSLNERSVTTEITDLDPDFISLSTRNSRSGLIPGMGYSGGEGNLNGSDGFDGEGVGLVPEEDFIIPQEGHRYAMEMRADGYMECSALTGELVWEVWEDVVKAGAKVLNGSDEGRGGCGLM